MSLGIEFSKLFIPQVFLFPFSLFLLYEYLYTTQQINPTGARSTSGL